MVLIIITMKIRPPAILKGQTRILNASCEVVLGMIVLSGYVQQLVGENILQLPCSTLVFGVPVRPDSGFLVAVVLGFLIGGCGPYKDAA